ncbi:MAG: HAD family hydrolase [Lachnospiraceae bacterium]|nr:HAD family hydrolase [Lachnospiraceae bacterium]
MKLDGIIFDIDGTIWDSREVVAKAWKAAFTENTGYEFDHTPEEIGKLFGLPMTEIFERLLPELSSDELEAMLPTLYDYEHRYLRKYKPAPYETVRETFDELSKEYPLFIVTNGQKGYAEAMLDATELYEYFTDWLSFGDTFTEKDQTLGKLIEKNGLKNTIYIGDTDGDYEAAKKNGLTFVFCSYGLGTLSEGNTPDYVINNMSELKTVLKKIEE